MIDIDEMKSPDLSVFENIFFYYYLNDRKINLKFIFSKYQINKNKNRV
jgi:hypothetical protein